MINPFLTSALISLAMSMSALADQRPNVLFCFSDDWGRYANIYRDQGRPGLNDVVHTPALDAIGRSGVLFNNAFARAPSCAAVATRMPFYRCGSNGFLRSEEYGKYLAYPDMDASPTMVFLMTNRDSYSKHFDIAFAVRPEFELYGSRSGEKRRGGFRLRKGSAGTRRRMMNELRDTGDPRVIGDGNAFDQKPFVDPDFVSPPKKKEVSRSDTPRKSL